MGQIIVLYLFMPCPCNIFFSSKRNQWVCSNDILEKVGGGGARKSWINWITFSRVYTYIHVQY